jgi:hypothetical protein
MSFPLPAVVEASTARPPAVTAAARLYLAAAGLALAYAVVVFTQVSTIADAERQAEVAHRDTGSAATAIAGAFALLGVAGLIFAALFVRCAVNVGRGAFGSRGGAWGITALAVLCLACDLTITGTGAGRRPFDPVTANVGDAPPLWYAVTAIALQAVALVVILAAAFLLTRPSAAAFMTPPGLRDQ